MPSMLYEPYRALDGLSPAAHALITYVRQKDYVTYAEMTRVLAPHIPIAGDLAIHIAALPNLIVWMGMSEAWVDTLNELFRAELLWREPCAILCYYVDGAVLQMPIAKRPPRQGYATPHWAPSCVRPIEHIAPRDRKKYTSKTPRGGKPQTAQQGKDA